MSSFVRNNTPVAGDAVSGANIRANHEGLRRWLNTGIRQADIASGSVGHPAIQAGEYASVTPDHRFATGNHYCRFVDAEPAHQSAVGQSMKPTDLSATLYVPVIGKRIRSKVSNGMALISAYLQILSTINLVNTATVGASDDVYLYVDGVQVPATISYFFAPDSAIVTGTDTSRYRVATIYHLAAGLSKGWHSVEIRVNPKHDLSLITARTLNIECLEL